MFHSSIFSSEMTSHSYEIHWRTVLRYLWVPVVIVAMFAGAARVWLKLHPNAMAAPEPLPVSMILAHQWKASAGARNISTVLIGDSSCLMGVDAPLLSAYLSKKENREDNVIDFGAISFYAMDEFANFVDRLIAKNRNQPKRIVLLIHPEMLRMASAGDKINESALFLPVGPQGDNFREHLLDALGLKLFEQRFVWAHVPITLANQFGSYYGYQVGLEEYMAGHNGSAVEAKPFQASHEKNVRFVLHEPIREATKRLRARLPTNIELVVAIMPIPFSSRTATSEAEIAQLRSEWPTLLRPCTVLTNLPMTLPDNFFATHTHLSPRGQEVFTRWLAEQIPTHGYYEHAEWSNGSTNY